MTKREFSTQNPDLYTLPETPGGLIGRLLCCGMRLRLSPRKRAIGLGPRRRAGTHPDLVRAVLTRQAELAVLMRDPRAACCFGKTDLEVPETEGAVAHFIEACCKPGGLISGRLLCDEFYHFAYAHDHRLPTLQQLYWEMDRRYERLNPLQSFGEVVVRPGHVVMWKDISIRKEEA